MMAGAMVLALALDTLLGTPGPVRKLADDLGIRIKRALPHLDAAGGLVSLGVVIGTGLLGFLVQILGPEGWPRLVLVGLLTWPLIGARALDSHVSGVAKALANGEKDTALARDTLEDLAHTASRRVVAPLFWGALLGLPGVLAYVVLALCAKANGAGDIQAVLGLADWVPTRLTGLLFALGARARGTAFRTIRRDAGGQGVGRAAWPEAALSGALGVRLRHPDRAGDPVFLNPVGGDPRPEDVFLGLRLYRRAILFLGIGLALCALLAR